MKRKPSLKTLRRKADRLFSIFIRQRDASGLAHNPVHLSTCCTCSTTLPWEKLDCGHYIKRQHLGTRYDERNAAPQCRSCNHFRGGNMDEFARYLTRKYGPGILDTLGEMKHQVVKNPRQLYESVIARYS